MTTSAHHPDGADRTPPGVTGPSPLGSRGGAVLVLAHTGRPAALAATKELAVQLARAGMCPVMLAEEAAALDAETLKHVGIADAGDPLAHVDLVAVLGGDGTILRASEVVRGSEVPLLGVNLGHVGFLAEAERDDLADLADRIAGQRYEVEERMTLDVSVDIEGRPLERGWAVNEATVEKSDRERMIEIALTVDGRPLTEFGCDGVVLATPTGSTAYAFSAGGPVVWPNVEALLVVPIAAHALFARPLVLAPDSTLVMEVLRRSGRAGVLWCDGRRSSLLPPGAKVQVQRGAQMIRLARLARPPFTDRLVAKFGLPVSGWRGPAQAHLGDAAQGPDDPADDPAEHHRGGITR